MIGDQPVGTIPGVFISSVSHEGLSVTVDGKPAKLAIVTDDGQIVAIGAQVAREAEAVAVNNYRAFWKGKGHLRVMSEPISSDGQVVPKGWAEHG